MARSSGRSPQQLAGSSVMPRHRAGVGLGYCSRPLRRLRGRLLRGLGRGSEHLQGRLLVRRGRADLPLQGSAAAPPFTVRLAIVAAISALSIGRYLWARPRGLLYDLRWILIGFPFLTSPLRSRNRSPANFRQAGAPSASCGVYAIPCPDVSLLLWSRCAALAAAAQLYRSSSSSAGLHYAPSESRASASTSSRSSVHCGAGPKPLLRRAWRPANG